MCILILDLTIDSASTSLCFAWYHLVAFVAGQCYNKRMAWKTVARLSGLVLFACRGITSSCFPASSKRTNEFVRRGLALPPVSVERRSLLSRLLKCEILFVLFFQQAWPTGTQQILIPSSWQQVPGVAIHSSAHQSTVAESPMEPHDSSSQQGHIWRSVDLMSSSTSGGGGDNNLRSNLNN